MSSDYPLREGWNEMPCGGAVRVKDGVPLEVSDQGRWAGEPTREIHDPGDALLEATGLPQLDQLALPTAMPQERGDRKPDTSRRPQLGKEEQRCAVPWALGTDRSRLQHDALQRKKPSALFESPEGLFRGPEGPALA